MSLRETIKLGLLSHIETVKILSTQIWTKFILHNEINMKILGARGKMLWFSLKSHEFKGGAFGLIQ